MTPEINSLLGLVDRIARNAPEYIDVLAAETEQEFDAALDVFIERAASHLETNSKNYASLSEVGLSAVFGRCLNLPGLSVVQEQNSNGHVDLTISVDHCFPARKKLCEAKIYDGPQYHIDGLNQLLNRYTTGREGRGIVLSYVKKKNIAGLVHAVRKKMDEELPCSQVGQTVDHKIRWSFISSHEHACGETLQVSHISCNMYNGSGDE